MTPDFKLGAFTAPLTSSTSQSVLHDADPALEALLAFIKAMLVQHLGARFDAEVNACGLSGLAGKIATVAVPFDPIPYLAQSQLAPPLLAVFVVDEEWTEHTRHRHRVDATFKILWCLPPLTTAQQTKLGPLRRAVSRVLVDRIEQGADPAYQSGAQVFGAAGISEIRVTSARYGNIENGLRTELFFPAVELELVVVERREAPSVQALDGIDGSVAVADQSGQTPLVDFEQDTP